MKRWPLVASFVLFIALCVSIAFWAMQLIKPPLRPVAAPPKAVQAPPPIDAAAALFGGRSNAVVASNFQLKGVLVSGTVGESIAILAADGKPAQSVRANTEIMPGITVKEVHRRYVVLLDNGVEKRVELPEEAPAMTSSRGTAAAPVVNNRPMPPRPAPAAPATMSGTQPPAATPPQAAQPGTPAQTPGQQEAPGGMPNPSNSTAPAQPAPQPVQPPNPATAPVQTSGGMGSSPAGAAAASAMANQSMPQNQMQQNQMQQNQVPPGPAR